MGAVTFPDAAVGSFLAEHFRGVRFDLTDPHPDFREATATAKVVWAPTFIVDDLRGKELRRWTGWFPPEEFIAELRIAIAQDRFHRKQPGAAIALLESVVEETPDAPAAPEAMHWLGIFGFLSGNYDWNALRTHWTAVEERYPGTRWARHSEVIADAPG